MILADILAGIDRWGAVVRVTITHCLGSTPRETGADMIVASTDFGGSIGGGKLEFMALEQARTMLDEGADGADDWLRKTDNFVLGTHLRQCCGGVVWLLFEYYDKRHVQALVRQESSLSAQSVLVHPINTPGPLSDDSAQHFEKIPTEPVMIKDAEGRDLCFVEPATRPTQPLVIYGAGHVGRALVRVLEDTPFAVSWVDINAERFPENISASVTTVIDDDPAQQVRHAPGGAFHVVISHSHRLDMDICRAVLESNNAGYLGLIASKTKKSKFLSQLSKDGVPDSALNVFHCPIGLGHWQSKQPSVIAISIAAQLVEVLEQGVAWRANAEASHIRVVGGGIT